jgi:hypothetical protein
MELVLLVQMGVMGVVLVQLSLEPEVEEELV